MGNVEEIMSTQSVQEESRSVVIVGETLWQHYEVVNTPCSS